MPCHAAMSGRMATLKTDDTVEAALARLKKDGQESAFVVDEQGRLAGVFSLQILLRNVLPVSIAVDGMSADVRIAAAPGISRRLKNMQVVRVAEIMERRVNAVAPDTPLWEGISALIQNNGPLAVIDTQSGKPLGAITFASALAELDRMRDSET